MEFSFLSRNVLILKFLAILPVFLAAFICRLHSPCTCSNTHSFHSSLHLHLSIQQSTHLFTRLFHYYRTSNLFFASTLSQVFIYSFLLVFNGPTISLPILNPTVYPSSLHLSSPISPMHSTTYLSNKPFIHPFLPFFLLYVFPVHFHTSSISPLHFAIQSSTYRFNIVLTFLCLSLHLAVLSSLHKLIHPSI